MINLTKPTPDSTHNWNANQGEATMKNLTGTYVAILFFEHEPCEVYGPFPTEEAATDWLNTRDDFGAATIHELRSPKTNKE